MKPIFLTCALLATVLCGSCASQPARETSVFPGHTIFPSEKHLPGEVVADLPRRITNLPQRQYTIRSLVKALGLSDYKTNVSSNFRWGTYFLYLDDDRILYMAFGESRTRKAAMDGPDWFHYLGSTDWDAKVCGIKLRENPDKTVIARDFSDKPDASGN